MLEKLTKWAEAGDGDAMYKLAIAYREGDLKAEKNISKSEYWLVKSAETKHIDAMKELAYFYRNGSVSIKQDYEKAINLYKEIAETYKDEEAMEAVVDMSQLSQGTENDEVTLDFILDIINKQFNEIYFINSGNIWGRILKLGTRRHNECTMQYLKAIERRRIANRIRRIKSANQ